MTPDVLAPPPARFPDAAGLREAARAYAEANPRARARGVAAALGVAEAQLVAARLPETGGLCLRPDFPDLLLSLERLGPLMALTRNEACVHEKTGVYRKGDMNAPHRMGMFLDEDIDLRLFFRAWQAGFFVEENGRLAFQFFNAAGEAVHKVYAVDGTDRAGMRALAETFADADQSPEHAVAPAAAPEEKDEREIDAAALLAGWRGLQDTHDFFGLLRTHGVSRRQAVRLAEHGAPELARRAHARAHRRALEGAAETGLEVMVFVGSAGCVQIHTGPVRRLVETGPWYNVLDAGFNLHLNEGLVAESWVVTKPTADGPVTALELFDAEGGLVAQVFGRRKPGIPELPTWRALAGTL